MKARALRIGLVVLLAVGIGLAWWSRNTWTAEAIVACAAPRSLLVHRGTSAAPSCCPSLSSRAG
jgi:hypothetical protein